MGLLLVSPLPIIAQHFVPVFESVYQPMNIVIEAATIDGFDLQAGDEIGIYDTTATGDEICVGSVVLSGPILPGVPQPIVASLDDPLTSPQDGFVVGHSIIYRFWDNSVGLELSCVTMTYNPAFDQVFVSLGTALGSLSGVYGASANAGVDDEICEDNPYTLSGSAANAQSTLWETSGDGTFDNTGILSATYTPGPTDVINGSATLTLTAISFAPCGINGIDDMVLDIQALPTADAGVDTATCDGAAFTLDGIASGQDSVQWSTAGDGTFDDPTILNATYTPGTSDISNGSVILTLTSYAVLPCATNDVDNMTLSFQMLPTADAGEDAEICANETLTLSGTATDYASILWTSSGDGTFDDATLLNAVYTPGSNDISSGSVTLTLTANAAAPCTVDASDMMELSIQAQPTANAGSDITICEGLSHTLSGNATNQTSVNWSTSGDGSFDNPTLLNATYTPGAGDIANGSVILSLTAFAILPCGTSTIDNMLLSINPLAAKPETPDGPTVVDIHFTPTSDYTTQSSAGASSYTWTLSPVSAGTIAGSGLTATVTWNTAHHGFAYIKVIAINSCGGVPSDSLEVDVYTTVGFSENDKTDLNVKIIPNPNNGHFKVSISTIDQELQFALYSSDGLIIDHNTVQDSEIEFDLTYLPKGLYLLRLYNNKTNHLEKIIIQ